MAVIPVVDPDDPRLSSFRVPGDAALIRERGLFLAEGRFVVERVLAARQFVVDAVLLNDASLTALGPALTSLPQATPIFVADRAGLERVTGIDFHRGCLALVRRPAPVPWQEVARHARRLVVLEGVTDADNVGAVFRNAAAFGADGVLLNPTCCDPLYRKAIRTSMGHALSIAFARIDTDLAALDTLRHDGWTVAALSPRVPSISLDEYVSLGSTSPMALLIGTEGGGLSDAAEQKANCRVRIPMVAGVDSVNLAVASGIALSRLYTASSLDVRRTPDQDP